MDSKFYATSKMSKIVSFVSQNKVDLIILNFLGLFTSLVSIFFLENYESMYDFDAYIYPSLAILHAEGTETSFDPFVIFLSFVYQLISDPFPLFALRISTILPSLIITIFFYMIARKIFNHFFSLSATLLAIFLPLSLTYSTTLHAEFFALSLGFVSLYFSINPKKFSNIAVSGFFIILAYMTRPDVYLIFVIPFSIGVARYIFKRTNIRLIYLIILCIGTTLIMTYLITTNLYDSDNPQEFQTSDRFQKIGFDTINKAFQDSIELTNNETINMFYLILIIGGSVGFILKYYYKIYYFLRHRFHTLCDSHWTGIYLIISYFVSLISLAAFHIYFNQVGSELVMRITPRYLLATQFIMVFGFIHAISFLLTLYPRREKYQ